MVVFIIAVLAGLALASMGRSTAAAAASSIASDMYYALNRARLEANSSGSQVRMWICRTASGTECPQAGVWRVLKAHTTGTGTISVWDDTSLTGVLSRPDAWLDKINDNAAQRPRHGQTSCVNFMPDGSVKFEHGGAAFTGCRIWVTDNADATHLKVMVWPVTGLVKMVNGW